MAGRRASILPARFKTAAAFREFAEDRAVSIGPSASWVRQANSDRDPTRALVDEAQSEAQREEALT
jgi:hypothetical protein